MKWWFFGRTLLIQAWCGLTPGFTMSTAPRSLRSETSLTSFAVSVGPRGPRGPRRCCGSRPHFRWLIYVKLGSSFLMNSSPKWPFLLEPYDVWMVKSRHEIHHTFHPHVPREPLLYTIPCIYFHLFPIFHIQFFLSIFQFSHISHMIFILHLHSTTKIPTFSMD